LLLKPTKMICVDIDRVTIKGGKTFGCVDCEVRLQDVCCTLLDGCTAVLYNTLLCCEP
jgi:hypothetical protein